jgi:hypothetical protein
MGGMWRETFAWKKKPKPEPVSGSKIRSRSIGHYPVTSYLCFYIGDERAVIAQSV